jgi:hypothetical protein
MEGAITGPEESTKSYRKVLSYESGAINERSGGEIRYIDIIYIYIYIYVILEDSAAQTSVNFCGCGVRLVSKADP